MAIHVGLTPWNLRDLKAQSLSAQASLAEGWGYESFWLPESHFVEAALPDPLMLLAAVAADTSNIRLATTSYLLPLRHPLLAAEQVAVLDQLSNGRVLLGIGRGFQAETFTAFDVDRTRKRELLAESLALMQRAWAGETISKAGVEITLSPLPVQVPHPPVWVAAFGPKALRQVAGLGLPYLASPMEPLATLQTNYALWREKLTTTVAEVPIMRSVFVSREKSILSRVRELLENFNLPRQEKSILLDDWAIVGEPDFVRDKVAEYKERLGVSHMIVSRLRVAGVPVTELQKSTALAVEVIAS